MSGRTAAWIALVGAFALTSGLARGAEATGFDLSSGCTVVGVRDASAVLGFHVQAPETATQSGGICTFATSALSEDGIVSYSIVTQADVVARRPYFRLLARRCGSVDARAPNAASCATYRKLAEARSVADYFADRTTDGVLSRTLGDAASTTPTALFVLRGGEVFEAAVRRGDLLDDDRSAALAKLLLERVAPLDAPPH